MKRSLFVRLAFLIALAASLSSAGNLPAQSTSESSVTRLELTPAGLPIPALRFSLLPELREQSPGNGASYYRKAGELFRKISGQGGGIHELLDQWEKLPLAELPRDDVRKLLELYKEPLDLIHRAARSEYCDFELAQRTRDEGFFYVLREVDYLNALSPLLGVKIRLELAENRPDLALQSLKTTYAMSRHLGEEPCLVCSLVGMVRFTSRANKALELVLSHPKTPNLSSSLLALPKPFLDVRRPLQGEKLLVACLVPGLLEVVNNPDAEPMKPEQLAKVEENLNFMGVRQLREVLLGGSREVLGPLFRAIPSQIGGRNLNRLLLGTMIQSRHEAAKKALVEGGWRRDQIDKWPHLQVALMHAVLEHDQLLDEVLQWQALPYWQAAHQREALANKVHALRQPGPDSPAIPLTLLLHPRLERLLIFRDQMDRHFAALRVIEAIRLYATLHAGKFPSTLADISEVPMPVCPISGKKFEYRLEGERALLSSPPVPKAVEKFQLQPLRYEITLQRGAGNG